MNETKITNLSEGHVISFKPFYKVLDIICQKLISYIESNKEIGEYEEADKWSAILNDITKNGILNHENDIQGFIIDLFESVRGRPNEYLGQDGVSFFDAVCEYYDPSINKSRN